MSTTDQRPSPAAGPEREPETKPKIDLSLTQVVGGALAAMTAAFLGSRLSLAGTITGAAVASIVAAVASNLYTASLRTTHEKVRTAFRGHVAGSDLPVTVEPAEEAFSWDRTAPAAARTPAPARPAGRVRWRSVLLGALAAFALAAAVLTGLELASGQSLSGGRGTTISQVAEHQPAAAKPSGKPTAAATPSASATDSPEPSASASPSASAPAEPSAEPSATPSAAAPTPSASATPSAGSTATPEPGSGDQTGAADQGAVG